MMRLRFRLSLGANAARLIDFVKQLIVLIDCTPRPCLTMEILIPLWLPVIAFNFFLRIGLAEPDLRPCRRPVSLQTTLSAFQ